MKTIGIHKLVKKAKDLAHLIAKILGETFNQWIDDKAFKMSAAVSFYCLFSLFPVLIITITILGKLYGEKAVRGELVDAIKDIVGQSGAETIQTLLGNVATQGQEGLAIVFGSVFILISSLVVFIELKESLNIIWGVEPKPGQPIKNLIRDRILAFVMVLGSALLFFLGLVYDSVLKALDQVLKPYTLKLLPILKWLNFLPIFVIATVVFALTFRFLPDVKVKWRYLCVGALATTVLFFIGRHLIGLYLGQSNWISVYGAAGSLVALLLWIYYSALIFFFGAELTQVIRHHFCKQPLIVSPNAVLVVKTSKMLARRIKKKSKR